MLPDLSYFLMFKFIHIGTKMTENTQEKEREKKTERLGNGEERERTNLGFPSLSENRSYHWVVLF